MKRNGWGGPNFNFSYMNLDKIKSNHAKKKINSVPKRALSPSR